MKIAWFTPFGSRSAIGTYSEVLLAELARTDDVTVFAPDGEGPDAPRATSHPLVALPPEPAADVIDRLARFDVAVYNLGNHLPYHLPIYECLLRVPGIAVLHDLVLRDFFFGYFFQHRRDPDGLARHLAYCHGPEAEAQGREIIAGRRRELPDDPDRLRFPMFKSALHRCLGVIVHSEYARGRVAADVSVPVRKIDFPPFGPATAYVAEPPARRVAPAGAPVRLLTFGVLNPNKLVHAVIEAIGRSDRLRSGATLTVIGDGHGSYLKRLRELIAAHHLEGVVTLAGWRSDDELRRELAESDVILNLRNPHTGESSAVLLNSLLAGVATVVWDHGFYAEFPDDVVLKVSSEEELPGALERLAGDADLRARLGRNAREHALMRFNTASFCANFRRFADEVMRAAPVLTLADHVADRLRELGANGLDGLAGHISEEIASFAPPAGAADGAVSRAA